MDGGASYLLSEWEADLNQLLARWPATAPLGDLNREIDLVLEKRELRGPHGEELAQRLLVAMSFLWHREKDSEIENFLIAGSSGSVVKPALGRALFRVIMAIPANRLNEPIDSDSVIRLIADDKMPDY